MKWHKQLYVGKSVENRKHRMMFSIRRKSKAVFGYVIALPTIEHTLLEIIPAYELSNKYYPRNRIYIIGLAGSHQEAMELACEILLETFVHTGEFFVPEYLQNLKEKG